MKITKIAESDCGSGSYCDGNFGGPTGHLDSQVFQCKKDPSVETRKKRKKKKAFNLKEYKVAMLERGEGMDPEVLRKLTPSNTEIAIEKFKKQFPGVAASVEEMIRWYKDNFIKPPIGNQIAKDLAHRPLD